MSPQVNDFRRLFPPAFSPQLFTEELGRVVRYLLSYFPIHSLSPVSEVFFSQGTGTVRVYSHRPFPREDASLVTGRGLLKPDGQTGFPLSIHNVNAVCRVERWMDNRVRKASVCPLQWGPVSIHETGELV